LSAGPAANYGKVCRTFDGAVIYDRFTRGPYCNVIDIWSGLLGAHWTEDVIRLQPVLVVTQRRAEFALITEQLRGFSSTVVTLWAETNGAAMTLTATKSPKLLFVDQASPVDGLAFVRALRRSDLPCREAPAIMLATQPTLKDMREAQNAGAHELLVRPFSAYQLAKRLEAIVAPRTWIETASYMGPDRRRFNSAALLGPDRRGPGSFRGKKDSVPVS
jgi:CheY-like chemotaxis protein